MMTSKELALWQRIQAYSFEGLGWESFGLQLVKQQDWTAEQAIDIITEYQKFMFLSVVTKMPCSPSEKVDEVWHLHLMYTQAYWEDWCEQVLQKQVHHQPTKGGQQEKTKHKDWYAMTLKAYEQYFEEAPNPAIWPSKNNHLKATNYQMADMQTFHVWRESSSNSYFFILIGLALLALIKALSIDVGFLYFVGVLTFMYGILPTFQNKEELVGWSGGDCNSCNGCHNDHVYNGCGNGDDGGGGDAGCGGCGCG